LASKTSIHVHRYTLRYLKSVCLSLSVLNDALLVFLVYIGPNVEWEVDVS